MESALANSGAAQTTVATATTNSGGRFTVKVKAGASRSLLIGYRHDSFQVARRLSLGTRAHPTLALSSHHVRGGRRVTFTGKLPGPRPAGRVLIFQGSGLHGHTWLTFRKVTTGRHGGYRATYRFTRPAPGHHLPGPGRGPSTGRL
jgi:hypothetical protein